jgi:hypothetical protein
MAENPKQQYRINYKPIVSWDIEEHTGERWGVGTGSGTVFNLSHEQALDQACEIKLRRNGLTIIGRNDTGAGKVFKLGFVKIK